MGVPCLEARYAHDMPMMGMWDQMSSKSQGGPETAFDHGAQVVAHRRGVHTLGRGRQQIVAPVDKEEEQDRCFKRWRFFLVTFRDEDRFLTRDEMA